MRVYIPSMDRAGQIGTRKMTHDWIKKATYVVPTGQVERYGRALLATRTGSYEIIGTSAKGIAQTRHVIGMHAQQCNESKFCMMDDDLTFCVRKGAESNALRPAEQSDIVEMLDWTEDALEDYAHASVSARAVANTDKMQSGSKEGLFQKNKRTLRYLAYRTADFLSVEHGRVTVMEDFDVNLQLLESGRANILHYWWAQDQRETGTAGGCSSYRSLETHNASAQMLHDLHPQFVKLRTKVNKSQLTKNAEALRERLEVTIQWEKAFMSSQKGRT